jgi:ATP-dependent DNA helicase RecG
MDFKDLMDATKDFKRFSIPQYLFPFHGKMKPADKDAEMKRFSEGKQLWSQQPLLK